MCPVGVTKTAPQVHYVHVVHLRALHICCVKLVQYELVELVRSTKYAYTAPGAIIRTSNFITTQQVNWPHVHQQFYLQSASSPQAVMEQQVHPTKVQQTRPWILEAFTYISCAAAAAATT